MMMFTLGLFAGAVLAVVGMVAYERSEEGKKMERRLRRNIELPTELTNNTGSTVRRLEAPSNLMMEWGDKEGPNE